MEKGCVTRAEVFFVEMVTLNVGSHHSFRIDCMPQHRWEGT